MSGADAAEADAMCVREAAAPLEVVAAAPPLPSNLACFLCPAAAVAAAAASARLRSLSVSHWSSRACTASPTATGRRGHSRTCDPALDSCVEVGDGGAAEAGKAARLESSDAAAAVAERAVVVTTAGREME